jgi:hypothetical protein
MFEYNAGASRCKISTGTLGSSDQTADWQSCVNVDIKSKPYILPGIMQERGVWIFCAPYDGLLFLRHHHQDYKISRTHMEIESGDDEG